MKFHLRNALVVFLTLSMWSFAYGVSYNVLHTFTGGSNDGANPLYGNLTLVGSTLYGTTSGGGSSNYGTLFKVGVDGTGFSVLHSFTRSTTDGGVPYSGLTPVGSTLYGMTNSGGANGGGTIFKINTVDNSYSVVKSFSGLSSPYSSLISDGSKLFGTTVGGGTNYRGTVFSINPQDDSYTLIHSFNTAAPANEGSAPESPVAMIGSTLYGMTSGGGTSGYGTIYKVNVDGTGFETLYSFGKATGVNGLIASGTTLYGTTTSGGNYKGDVFKFDPSTKKLTTLHAFAGYKTDGDSPQYTLSLVGSTLYGTTYSGGSFGNGTLYKLNTDGTAYEVLYNFSGASDGILPYGGVIANGSMLYGMTEAGGASGKGVIYGVNVPEPSTFALLGTVAVGLVAFGWGRCRRRAA